MVDISKINGLPWANVSKVNGLAIANISKINGVLQPAGGGGGGPYTPLGVSGGAGTDWAEWNTPITGGQTLETQITCSCWLRSDSAGAAQGTYFYGNGARSMQMGSKTGPIYLRNKTVANGISTFKAEGTFDISDGAWHHILLSFDSNNQAGSLCYVDDAPDPIVWGAFTTGETWESNVTPYAIFEDLSKGAPWVGEMADFWLAPTWMDITVVANRRKFIAPNGGGVDLGTTGQLPLGINPLLCFNSQDPATWHNNVAATGGFTLAGAAFTAAATNPPTGL